MDISNKYTLTLRNTFDALQEISETLILNDEHENFVNAHIEVAAEYIPTKQRGCDGKLTRIPKQDFNFARVKTGQVGTWSPIE